MEISLQDLKRRNQLSNELLNTPLSEEHLREASRVIDDHEILGPELGLSAAQMTAIEQKKSPVLQMLEKWRQKGAWKATYCMLIEALLKCSRADLAQKLCEWLVQSKFKDIPVNVDMQVTTLSLVIAGASPEQPSSSPDQSTALPPSPVSHDGASSTDERRCGMFTYFHNIVAFLWPTHLTVTTNYISVGTLHTTSLMSHTWTHSSFHTPPQSPLKSAEDGVS